MVLAPVDVDVLEEIFHRLPVSRHVPTVIRHRHRGEEVDVRLVVYVPELCACVRVCVRVCA